MIFSRYAVQTIVKLNLISPMLVILFPIICDLSSDDEEDSEAAGDGEQSPSSCALQVTVSLCLPSETHSHIQFNGHFCRFLFEFFIKEK